MIQLLWLVPALVVVICALFSYANIDTTRDYVMAYRIASGNDFPLTGQQLAFSFSIAPWWFYLLSVVLLFKKSWLATSVFVAVLNASKFYLAYQIGQVLGGRLLGVLMVLCLTMVSLSLMQGITFTHTNLVEPVILLIVFLTLKDDKNSVMMWLLYGFIAGLAFHAHPTAFLAGFFILLKWLDLHQKTRNALVFIIGLLLVFSPLLIHDLFAEKTMIQGTTKYLENQLQGFNLNAFVSLIAGLWVYSPYAFLKSLFSQNVAVFLITVQFIVQIIAMATPFIVWRNLSHVLRRFLIQLWLFFILSCLGLILIRTNTPWYMTYGVTLTVSLITAIGLYALYTVGHFKKAVFIFACWFLLVYIGTQCVMVNHITKAQLVVPSSSLHDVKSLDSNVSEVTYEIMAYQASAHGQFSCQYSPVSLNGPYSHLIYTHSGMEHMSECNDGLYYGDAKLKNQLIGVPPQYAQQINLKPIHQIGSTYFYYPKAVSDKQTGWAETFEHDYERVVKYNSNWKQQVVEASLTGGQHLIITNLIGFKMPLEVLTVHVDGQVIESLNQQTHSLLYVCEKCDVENSQWKIQYREGVAGMTNVVSF